MFCSQCGANNAEGALICAQCGRNLQAPAIPLQTTGVVLPPGQTVPNYLVFSILATACCCLPAGIPAIVYASQVNSKLQTGDLAGAQAASNNAKMWCWISLGLGLAVIALSVMVGILRMMSGIHGN
jgi:hypothetical protein